MDLVTKAELCVHAQILRADAAFLGRDDLARSVPKDLARSDQDRQASPALCCDIATRARDLELRVRETDADLGPVGIELVLNQLAQDVRRSMRQYELIDLARSDPLAHVGCDGRNIESFRLPCSCSSSLWSGVACHQIPVGLGSWEKDPKKTYRGRYDQ